MSRQAWSISPVHAFHTSPAPILSTSTETTNARSGSSTGMSRYCATNSPDATPTEDTTSDSRCLASPSKARELVSPAFFMSSQESPPFIPVATRESTTAYESWPRATGANSLPSAALAMSAPAKITRAPSMKQEMFSTFWCP